MDKGLRPGGLDKRRDENHFLPIRPEQDAGSQRWLGSQASMPGMRVGTDIIIYFDTKLIINPGVKLHQSAGCAVLTKQHVPARAIISVRARENGAVKHINVPRVDVCSTAERMVAIGNDHEKTLKRGMKMYVRTCQPPPPTWTPEEEEATGSSQPPPPKRSCSEVEKEDVDTLPSWRDEFDDVDWGTEDEADKNALRRKPDADASRLSTPGSPDVLPPKKESETEATHDADPPHRATNADVKPVLKERKSKQAGWACPGCGSTKQLGMTQCTVCHRALKREAVEDRQRNLDIVLKAVKGSQMCS